MKEKKFVNFIESNRRITVSLYCYYESKKDKKIEEGKMRISFKGLFIICFLVFLSSFCWAGEVFDRIQETGIVKIGVEYDIMPSGYIDKENQWVGFDIDMSEALVDHLKKYVGKELKIDRVKVDNETRISFIVDGKIDLSIANMTHTKKRDDIIDFSITYFFDGQKILAKKGRFEKLEDFAGKLITVENATTAEKKAFEILTKLGVQDPEQYILARRITECFELLKNDEVDGWLNDTSILLAFSAIEPGEFELIGDFLSKEPYGVGLPENDSDWRDAVNFAIQDIWSDGTYMKIYNKWYGPESSFHFPLSEEIEIWP